MTCPEITESADNAPICNQTSDACTPLLTLSDPNPFVYLSKRLLAGNRRLRRTRTEHPDIVRRQRRPPVSAAAVDQTPRRRISSLGFANHDDRSKPMSPAADRQTDEPSPAATVWNDVDDSSTWTRQRRQHCPAAAERIRLPQRLLGMESQYGRRGYGRQTSRGAGDERGQRGRDGGPRRAAAGWIVAELERRQEDARHVDVDLDDELQWQLVGRRREHREDDIRRGRRRARIETASVSNVQRVRPAWLLLSSGHFYHINNLCIFRYDIMILRNCFPLTIVWKARRVNLCIEWRSISWNLLRKRFTKADHVFYSWVYRS